MAVNLARLNHILIPDTKEGRDRVRSGLFGRLIRPLGRSYAALSDEGRAVFGFAMLAGLAGLDVGRTQNHIVWATLLALVLGSIALRPLFRMRGVRIEVEPPHLPTVGEDAPFRVSFVNDGERDHHSVRSDRPFLPWDGQWRSERPRFPLLPAGENCHATLVARFRARGQHHLDSFSAAALVPLGLAVGERVQSLGVRFTVVPRVARVTLGTLPRVRHQSAGASVAAGRLGESTELLGLRPYRGGDRLRDLHARTWARIGKPVVREYQQEYFSRVGVVLDTDRRAADERGLEAGVSLAGGILAAVARSESLGGDLLVTGSEGHRITLGRGPGGMDQALDRLACVSAEPAFDPARVLELLRSQIDSLSCLYLVALAWDERRAWLTESLRRAGVACRITLVVPEGRGAPPGRDRQITTVAVPDIERACLRGRAIEL